LGIPRITWYLPAVDLDFAVAQDFERIGIYPFHRRGSLAHPQLMSRKQLAETEATTAIHK
jgi:hypothetical protein